jgi:hypothetical protein
MADEIKPPAIVLALAAKVNGVPYSWREDEQEIVIVLKDGRKIKFLHESVPVIHTKADAEAAVSKLTPTHKPQPKKKEK